MLILFRLSDFAYNYAYIYSKNKKILIELIYIYTTPSH